MAKIPALRAEFLRARLRWLANLEFRTSAEYVNRKYVNWWLFYLLLITCVPFSTIVVGRFAHLPPAVWLYAGHTLLIALVGMRLAALTPGLERDEHMRRRQLSGFVLIGSSLLAIALSFLHSAHAMWAFALNLAVPVMRVWLGRRVLPD